MKKYKVIDEDLSSKEVSDLLDDLSNDGWCVYEITKNDISSQGFDTSRNKKYKYFILLEKEDTDNELIKKSLLDIYISVQKSPFDYMSINQIVKDNMLKFFNKEELSKIISEHGYKYKSN